MSDYISRADAIKAVRGLSVLVDDEDFSYFEDALKALPSADAEFADLPDIPRYYYERIVGNMAHEINMLKEQLESADAVSREEYKETDGVVTIEKKNANEVGEIKHIIIRSPNYTRYFYNESMPFPSADAEQTDKLENQPCLVERNYTTEGGGGEIYHPTRQHGKWLPIEETIPTYDGGEKTWLTGMKCSNCGKLFDLRVGYYFCPSCGARIYKGGGNK